MKSPRMYFLMALVGLMTGLSLVACSKKTAGGPGLACPAGFVSQNNTCVYDPNNPGNGGFGTPGSTAGSGIAYGKNGQISNMDQFRDFNLRVSSANMSGYYCLGGGYIYNRYFDCSHAYVALIRYGTSYYVQIASPSLTYQYVSLPATKFGGSTASQSIFEIQYNNPYPYMIAELVINGDIETASSVSYTLNYLRNSGTKLPIISGTMYKGYDY